jgi:hypothetical protein
MGRHTRLGLVAAVVMETSYLNALHVCQPLPSLQEMLHTLA